MPLPPGKLDIDIDIVKAAGAAWSALAVRTVPAPPRLKGFRHCMNLTPGMTDSPFLYDRSGAQYLLTDRRWRGDDGSPLELSALPGHDAASRSTPPNVRCGATRPRSRSTVTIG